jgi:hypothetical protein
MSHPLVEAYLDRLECAAAHLPRARRRELVDEIEAHLNEALGPSPIEAEIALELERLGDPREIAEAEAPRPPEPDTGRRLRPTPLVVLALLVVGSLFGPLGMVPGLVAMYFTRGWNRRDRVIVTALCLAAMVLFDSVTLPAVDRGNQLCGLRNCHPNSALEIALALSIVVIPLAAAAYLTRRRTRSLARA